MRGTPLSAFLTMQFSGAGISPDASRLGGKDCAKRLSASRAAILPAPSGSAVRGIQAAFPLGGNAPRPIPHGYSARPTLIAEFAGDRPPTRKRFPALRKVRRCFTSRSYYAPRARHYAARGRRENLTFQAKRRGYGIGKRRFLSRAARKGARPKARPAGHCFL